MADTIKVKDRDLGEKPPPMDEPVETRGFLVGNERMNRSPEALLEEMRIRAQRSNDYFEPIYRAARSDVDFIYGEQWPAAAKAMRGDRPMLTLNKLPTMLSIMVGEVRKSKFSIEVKQLSGNTTTIRDQATNGTYSRPQVMGGLIKDIEERSEAAEQYARAYTHECEGGFGYLSVMPRRDLDDPFNLELRIEHIPDRWSVLLDSECYHENFSDGKWCAKYMRVTEEEFMARWPDKRAESFNENNICMFPGGKESGIFWNRDDQSRFKVLHYWWKEPMKRTAVEFIKQEKGGPRQRLVLWEDEFKHVFDELDGMGFEENNRATVASFRVLYMVASATQILYGPFYWKSRHLPIVPVIGRRGELNGMEQWRGMFRDSYDAQRMFNYWASSATEKISFAPKNPFLIGQSQLSDGVLSYWSSAETSNRFFLPYNDMAEGNQNPPQRSNNVEMAQGELMMFQTSGQQIKETVGMFDAQLGKKSNEVSGIALAERQEQGETGQYEYMDSLTLSIKRIADILLDMIPQVYNNDIPRRIVLPDDEEIIVDLNTRIKDEETKKMFRIYTLDFARYTCRVKAGLNSTTMKERFVAMMSELVRSDPEGAKIWIHKLVQHMDVPFARDVARAMMRAVPPQFLSEEERRDLKIDKIPITPEQQIEQLRLETEKEKATFGIKKADLEFERSRMQLRSDEAKTEFTIARGLEDEEKRDNEAGQGEASMSKEQIENLVATAVKRAVAEEKAKSAPREKRG